MAVVILAGGAHIDVEGAVEPDARLAPHQLHVRPAHVHLLRGVVGVQAGVEQQLMAARCQQQPPMEQQADLNKKCVQTSQNLIRNLIRFAVWILNTSIPKGTAVPHHTSYSKGTVSRKITGVKSGINR